VSAPRTLRVLLLSTSILVVAGTLADAAPLALTCPGKERWSVKTGTDVDAARVDTSQIVQTTIVEMRSWQAPRPRPSDRRANAVEMTVYTITGFLTKWKREPDQDYHLIIADQNRNTIIAEVPNTGCIRGTSPFAAGIETSRDAVDDQINVTGRYPTDEAKIPVRVTGVGFFDKSAHGAGAPPNGIELHPVIAIVFNPSGTTPVTPPSAPSLINDPGFEATATAWVASESVITRSTERSHTGKKVAWLGGYGSVHTDTLSQVVALPSSATRITLTYWLRIDTSELPSRGSFESKIFDTLTLELRSSGGAPLETLAGFNNRDAHGSYERRVVDLSRYAGQTVVLLFTAEEDRSRQTSFLLDDFSIELG
jgi:hypothetical protein